MPKRKLITMFRIGAGLLSVAVAAVAASHALGGPVSIIGVKGTSMQPALHDGDAVLVWSEPDYEPGDVIAYRSGRLDAVVLHRVVEKQPSGYVTKGDDNDWLDPDKPTASAVIGRRLLTLPGIGAAAKALRSPGGMSVVALAGFVLVAAKLGRRRRRSAGPTKRPPMDLRLGILVVAGASAMTCAAIAVVAVTAPAEETSSVRHSFTHQGEFDYSAQIEPGVAYRSGEVSTGDPVFRKLVSSLDVSFGYQFDAASAHAVSGRASLMASIGDGLGWTHVIPLSRSVALDEGRAELEGTLDLRRVQNVIDEMQVSTGLTAQTYTVELVAKTEVSGDVVGVPIAERFSPRFPLSLDHIRLQPAADPTPQDGNVPHRPTQTGTVEVGNADAGSPSILGLSSRPLALAAAVAFILSLLAAAAVSSSRQRATHDDAALIRAALRRRLIAVASDTEFGPGRVIEVASATAFVELARQFDAVMEARTPQGADFFVHDAVATYRYSCDALPIPCAARVEEPASAA